MIPSVNYFWKPGFLFLRNTTKLLSDRKFYRISVNNVSDNQKSFIAFFLKNIYNDLCYIN